MVRLAVNHRRVGLAASASIQRPRDGDDAAVAAIRKNSLRESPPRTSAFWPRFRYWRPAGCPAKPRRSGTPVVKLRQDSLAQPSEQVEFTDLQSLRCPFRDLGIVFLPCTVLLTSERRQFSIIPDDSSFGARRLPVCHAFVSPYRIHIVGFVCRSDSACLQISVLQFQHFGCG